MNTPGSKGPRRPRRPTKAPQDEVHRITTAADSLRADQARRTRRYLIQMSIRLVCLIAAVFTHGILMWVLLAAAVVLPYIAVIEANVGRDTRTSDLPPMEYHQLPGAPSTPAVPPTPADPPPPSAPYSPPPSSGDSHD